MDEDCKGNGLELENLQLIDILSEDDFLIDSQLGDSLEGFRLSAVFEDLGRRGSFKLMGTSNMQEAENEAELLKHNERKLFLSESRESRRSSFLRKSLAWDNAFFTNAGVLDPEELFVINKGVQKVETPLLPFIQEDLCLPGSAYSESTLDSDGFSFESNQSIEDDLFQDIRASIQRSSIMSGGFRSGPKSGDREVRKQRTQHLKKVGMVSPETSARSGEPNLFSLMPPKIQGKMNPVLKRQMKRVSVVADHARMENGSATSASVSVTASNYSTASSSKSSSNSRSKALSRRTRLAATCSTSNTPSRCSPGGKNGLGNPSFSTHLLSLSNHSYESLASSIDGWSSESSSTSANQKSNCVETSSDTSTSKGTCLTNCVNQAFDHKESQQTRVLNHCIGEIAATGDASTESIRKFRPSGLRKPSPKIGFFDEEKSSMPSVSWGLHPHVEVSSVSPEISEAASRKRHGKPQFSSTLSENGRITPGSEQTGSPCSPLNKTPSYSKPKHKLDKNSPIASNPLALGTLRKFPGKISKVLRDISPQSCRENCSKTRKVGDGKQDARRVCLHSSLKVDKKRTEGIVVSEMCRESKKQNFLLGSRITPSKSDPPLVNKDTNPSKKETKRTKRHYLENDPYSLHKNVKQNLSTFEDQVNGLSRYFEVIDLDRDIEGNNTGCSHSAHNSSGDSSVPVSSNFCREHLHCQEQVSPNMTSETIPLPTSKTVEFVHSTRTPLADRNFVTAGAKPFEVIERKVSKSKLHKNWR